jgi:ribonuclease P protein component
MGSFTERILISSITMLTKSKRGLQSSHIQKLFRESNDSKGSAFFRIVWQEVQDEDAKFVVIVSKKVHSSAVVRNKLKRQIYAMLEKNFSGWTRGLRVAILVKTPVLRCDRRRFQQEFLSVMRSTGLL